METGMKAFFVKVSLAIAIAGGLATGAGLSHAEPAVSAPLTCEASPEYMPAGECGPIRGLTPSEDYSELCSPENVSEAWRELFRGNYDGTLSTCAGVDEDSPVVDVVLRVQGK